MAMPTHQLNRPRSLELERKQSPTISERVPVQRNPLSGFQGAVGNRALQRFLIQRNDQSSPDNDVDREYGYKNTEQILRKLIQYRDEDISRIFVDIENQLKTDKDETNFRKIESVKKIHASTGMMTLGMLETVRQGLHSLKFPEQIELHLKSMKAVILKKEQLQNQIIEAREWSVEKHDKFRQDHIFVYYETTK